MVNKTYILSGDKMNSKYSQEKYEQMKSMFLFTLVTLKGFVNLLRDIEILMPIEKQELVENYVVTMEKNLTNVENNIRNNY